MNAIVVDNNAGNRIALRLALESRGVTVIEAATVDDARMLARVLPIEQVPQLALIDHRLGSSVTGCELLPLLRRDRPAGFAHALLVTGYGSIGLVQVALDAGFAALLEKPVALDELDVWLTAFRAVEPPLAGAGAAMRTGGSAGRAERLSRAAEHHV